jgi:hypothetical protein
MKNKLVIIDADSICYTACFGVKIVDEEGNPIKVDNKFTYRDKTEEEVYHSIDSIIVDIFANTYATHYTALIKGKNTISSRKEINPTYKSNRVSELPKHYNIAKRYLIDTWGCFEVNDYEVDDVVNASYLYYLSQDNYFPIRVSIDKDLMSLEGTNYNWRKKETLVNTKEDEKYFFWASMITGDSADGCKGLPNKGIKFAEKTLKGEGMLEKNCQVYPQIVQALYIQEYGEDKGIREFYKSYNSLKILDFIENYSYSEPIKIELPEEIIDSKEELPDFNER